MSKLRRMNLSMPVISRPPREVPLPTKLVVLFGSPLSQFGWVFFGFGMVFVWLFAANADWSSLFSFRGALETAPGIITASEQTNASEGGGKRRKGVSNRRKSTPIFAHQFKFSYGGAEYTGTSYCPSGGLRDNQTVTVEFPVGKPTVSRICGMRRGVFGLGAAFVLIFPAVGLALALQGLFSGRKAIQLLANGVMVQGLLTDKTATNTRVNKRPVMKLTFEFTDALGQLRQAVLKTADTERLEDNPFERIFYDPQNPKSSVLLDALPGKQGFDGDGRLKASGFGRAFGAIVLPIVAATVVAIGFWWKVFR